MSARKRSSFRWLLLLLAASAMVFASVVPAGDRIKVLLIFAGLTPFAILTFFYVMRRE